MEYILLFPKVQSEVLEISLSTCLLFSSVSQSGLDYESKIRKISQTPEALEVVPSNSTLLNANSTNGYPLRESKQPGFFTVGEG